MIVFDPFWQFLKEHQISTYDLEYQYGLNPADISRLKHNHNYTLRSIERFCKLFSCQPNDIILYKETEKILIPSEHISQRK